MARLAGGLEMRERRCSPRRTDPTDRSHGGLVTRINERLFRAYRWIDHRPVTTDDDIACWLDSTMARIHQIEPVAQIGLPKWRHAAALPLRGLGGSFTLAQRRESRGPGLAWDRLPHILDVSARIEALCEMAAEDSSLGERHPRLDRYLERRSPAGFGACRKIRLTRSRRISGSV
jgi:hypothetical protein